MRHLTMTSIVAVLALGLWLGPAAAQPPAPTRDATCVAGGDTTVAWSHLSPRVATVSIRWRHGGSFVNSVDVAAHGGKVSVTTDGGVVSSDAVIILFFDRNAVEVPKTSLDFSCT